jgi:uroporphyrin-III C-methyltransferase
VTVYLVGAGPGDPGLLTVRGAALLAGAEVVVHDRLIAHELLDRAPAGAALIDVGKVPGAPSRQAEINALLIEHGQAGREVVRLKGGDPFVLGRGGEEAEALQEAGVDYEIVPGVSSAFAAPAAAGIPLTHRGLATSVSVVTGTVGTGTAAPAGAVGPDRGERDVDWRSLAKAGGTLVVLMGMSARAEIARELIAGGRPPDTPVAVVHWGATARQRVVRSTLEGLADVDLPPPAAIVVGPVAALDLAPPMPGTPRSGSAGTRVPQPPPMSP